MHIDPTEIFSDIFKKYDTDHSGYIDFNEFEEFCKSMGLYMDKDKMQRIYSKADLDNDYQLDMQEFQYSIILMKVEIAIDTLKKLGMTTEDLIWFGIIGLVLLLMLFAFIFFGISAFSKADVFNSVINSIMPITAGIAVAARRLDLKAEIEKVKTFVQSILAQYRKKL